MKQPLVHLLVICLLACATSSRPTDSVAAKTSQAGTELSGGCIDTLTSDSGYKFRSVKVKVRYPPVLDHPLPVPGTNYSPEVVTRIVEDVYAALTKEDNRENEVGETEQALLSSVTVGKGRVQDKFGFGIKFVTACTKQVDKDECKRAPGINVEQCVDVSIHVFSARIDTANPISNLMNIPRSNRPTFLSKVPGPLLALTPKFGLNQDRALGPTGTLAIAMNLLDLGRNIKSRPLNSRRTQLDLLASGNHSLTNPFYEATSKLSLSRAYAGLVERLAVDVEYNGDHTPLADSDYLRNIAAVSGSVRLRTNSELFESIWITAGYERSRNRLSATPLIPRQDATEQSFSGNVVVDGRLARGTQRLALWTDATSPKVNGPSYQRAAVLWGYQNEILISPNQTVGFELLVGAGKVWGSAPQYSRFFGGNSSKTFMYEPKDSPALRSFPEGPLIRSFGSGSALAGRQRGATSYWNVNLNVTVPIPAWSSPIVPDITISLPKKDDLGHPELDNSGEPVMEERPLRTILKNQGQSSRKILERIFVKQGLPVDEAQAKARRELRSIESILGFIADRANIYSFKPLFMFDAARLNAPGGGSDRMKYAIGGGLQFTLVIAKFEAGYMRTLHRLPGDDRGNFVMRLYFQNLY
jgi:hypothetical protein